jgi:hypothetical protein
MADQVQFILDRMTSSLRSAEELGVFSHPEIQSIVRKRTDFEYVLKRRQLTPADFVGYLRYEMNLEKLRELRCQRFEETSRSREEKDATRNVKTCFARHVCYIFDRGLRRFPAEASLWTDYIEYLKKSNSNAILNTVLGRAIALFPKDENFWVEAAAHELTSNNSAETARKLLQRALRVNRPSRRLWQRYFELELWNVARISNRKKILKIDEAEEELERLRVKSAPLVVFRYAVAAVPDVDFAYALYALSLEVSGEVAGSILREMKATLGHRSSLWAAVAYAEVSKKMRQVSAPAAGGEGGEGAAMEAGDAHNGAAGTAKPTGELLLARFATAASVLLSGMAHMRDGLDSFGVGSSEAAPAVTASEKKSKKQRSSSSSSSESAAVAAGSAPVSPCTSEDVAHFLQAFSQCMHVAVGAVAAVYADAFSADGDRDRAPAAAAASGAAPAASGHVLAAFRVLDMSLAAARAVLDRVAAHLAAADPALTTFDVDSLLVLCRFRLGLLLQFSDYFSAKWQTSANNAEVEGVKSKKRKSVAPSETDGETEGHRQALCSGEYAAPFAAAAAWLGGACSDQWAAAARAVAVSAAPAPVPRTWLLVADAVLGCALTASQRCEGMPAAGGGAVSGAAPGDFWWSACPAGGGAGGLAAAVEELCKTISAAAGIRFAEAVSASAADRERDEKISAVKVISRAQNMLMKNSDLSHSCEMKRFVTSSMQKAVTSRLVSAADRMFWICEYLRLAYGAGAAVSGAVLASAAEDSARAKAGRGAYAWCVSALDAMPGILFVNGTCTSAEDAMLPLFEQVLELEEVEQYAEDRSQRRSGSGSGSADGEAEGRDQDKVQFLGGVLRRALRDCPAHGPLLDTAAAFYGATGDHKKANHLRWKKNNSM